MIKSEPCVMKEGYIRETRFANTCLLRTQSSQKYNACSASLPLTKIKSKDHSFLAYQKEWNSYKKSVSHSHMFGMCAHAQVPTSPTFGGKSRCSQACIKLSTIPSPNKPASTVSVTTKETLDKKNMMYNKPSCQQSIILLKKKTHHTNMSSEQNFYQHSGVSVHMGNLILQKNYVFWIVVRSYWRCR